MQATVNYQPGKMGGTDTDRWPSPRIWDSFEAAIARRGHAIELWDDFDAISALAPTETTQVLHGKYKAYATGSGVVGPVTSFNSTETGGGIIGLNNDTAGDQATLIQIDTPFRIKGTTAGNKLAFEARIATTQIVTNDACIFVGLGETDGLTGAAAVPLADANTNATGGAMVGFFRLEDGLGVLGTYYADRASPFTTYAIDATAGTIAALTWTKLGMVYDPVNVDSNGDNLTFYQDGVNLGTGLTNAELAALTYLEANNLGVLAAIFADSAGTSSYLYIDWWRCAQILD